MAKKTTETPAAKKPAAKAAPKAAPKVAKTVAPPKEGRAPNALQTPLTPSADLAAIVGPGKLPRGEMVSKVWAYIKQHNLQNPANKREILADPALRKIFGKDSVTMFEMNKHLAGHLK